MSASAPPRADRSTRVQLALSVLLRGGVLVSAGIVVTGLAIGMLHEPGALLRSNELVALRDGGRGSSHDWRTLVGQLRHLRAGGVVMLGLLVLVATPVARVVLSLVLFSVDADRRFVAITAGVLAMLVVSFALGHAGG